MKFSIKIIIAPTSNSPKQEIGCLGREISSQDITFGDMEKIIEVEHFLEKITGCRWHIQEVIENK